jgi:hypothetical protein
MSYITFIKVLIILNLLVPNTSILKDTYSIGRYLGFCLSL